MNHQKAMTPVSILRKFFSIKTTSAVGEMKALSKDERMELATLCALEMNVTIEE
jgi:hypothetical protein